MFLGTHKPAILVLQEARVTLDNKSTFYHKLYQTFSQIRDLVTFVRKDFKAHLIPHPPFPFSIMALQIQGEEENFQLTNIYARDSQLKCAALIELFSTFPKLILVGDLNAKHHQLLPHSQLVPHNINGKELHSFMEGRDTLSANSAQAHIHNLT